MSTYKATLLYVEDDENLAFVTTDHLEYHGYKVIHCKTGKEAQLQYQQQDCDVCILDIMLPEMDGFALAQWIRTTNQQIPILFLTARSLKEDKIAGLKLGADDYLTKPFSIEELVLKVEVFLRRSQIIEKTKSHRDVYDLGNTVFDFAALSLTSSTAIIQLTMKEAELLRLFCQHPNKILKREEILKAIWGDDDYFMGRSMDVFISRLRKHLKTCEGISLDNIHNVGFRLGIKA